jgi:hypothetical protein
MMSDMKTFTVRDLDRKPGEVLRACRADGVALIRSRDGATYAIRPCDEQNQAVRSDWFEKHQAWLLSASGTSVDRAALEAADELVAGA